MTQPTSRRKGRDFNVNVGTSLPVAIVSEIEALARKYGTTKASVLRELAVGGLTAYHRDGKLGDFAEDTNGAMAGTTISTYQGYFMEANQ